MTVVFFAKGADVVSSVATAGTSTGTTNGVQDGTVRVTGGTKPFDDSWIVEITAQDETSLDELTGGSGITGLRVFETASDLANNSPLYVYAPQNAGQVGNVQGDLTGLGDSYVSFNNVFVPESGVASPAAGDPSVTGPALSGRVFVAPQSNVANEIGTFEADRVTDIDVDGNGTINGAPVEQGNGNFTVAAFDNLPPDAVNDAGSTAVNTPVDLNILLNDSDPEGDPFSIIEMTQPTNGSVVQNLDGTVTYTPDTDFEGVDSFTYTIRDTDGNTDTATVDVSVAVPTPPMLDLDCQAGIVPSTNGANSDFVELTFSGAPTINNNGKTLDADGIAETARYSDVATIDGQSVDLLGYVVSAEKLGKNGLPNGQDSDPRLVNQQLDSDGSANVRFDGNSVVEMRWVVVESDTEIPVTGNFALLINDLDGNSAMTRYERVTVEKDTLDSYALEADPNNPTNVIPIDNGDTITFQPNDSDPGAPGARPDNSVGLTFRNTSEFNIVYEKLNSGGNVGLDGSYGDSFFGVADVADTNPDFGNLFTEDGPAVAIADTNTAKLDTFGVGATKLSFTPDPATIPDGSDEKFVILADGAPIEIALDGSDGTLYTFEIDGQSFDAQFTNGQIDVTPTGGGIAPDDAFQELLTRTSYSNQSELVEGLSGTDRLIDITLMNAAGQTTPPATSTIQVVGINDDPDDDDETAGFTEGSTAAFTVDVAENASDPEWGAVTLDSIDTAGIGGTVPSDDLGAIAIVNGEIEYTPSGTEAPGDFITIPYTVTDPDGGSNDSVLTLFIEPDTDRDGIANAIDIDDDNDGITDAAEGVESDLDIAGKTVEVNGTPITSVTALSENDVVRIINVGAEGDTTLDALYTVGAGSVGVQVDPSTGAFTSIGAADGAANDYFTLDLQFVETGTTTQVTLDQFQFTARDLDSRNGEDATEILGVTGTTSVRLGDNLGTQGFQGTSDAPDQGVTYVRVDPNSASPDGEWTDEVNTAGFEVSNHATFYFEDFTSTTIVSGVTGSDSINGTGPFLADFCVIEDIDTDIDGVADRLDLDTDNDGISDLEESGVDTTFLDPNGNGTIDGPQFQDSDSDGLADSIETANGNDTGTTPINSDDDNFANWRDLDSDNDGISDFIENQPTADFKAYSPTDSDGDGVINLVDGVDGFGGNFDDPANSDGTDSPDYLDLNSDNDVKGGDIDESGLPTLATSTNGINDGSGVTLDNQDGEITADGLAGLAGELSNLDNDPTEVDFRSPPCFVRGTQITTIEGQVAVEDLRAGDQVLTLDGGYQEIRWIGSRVVQAQGDLAPVRIKANALGNTRDLLVSPLHRMMITGWKAEIFFGQSEVLVPAKMMIDDDMITTHSGGTVEYFHVLFDKHEIVFAEGSPSESFHPGHVGLGSFLDETRAEILTIFPELRNVGIESYGATALPTLRSYEATLLI